MTNVLRGIAKRIRHRASEYAWKTYGLRDRYPFWLDPFVSRSLIISKAGEWVLKGIEEAMNND